MVDEGGRRGGVSQMLEGFSKLGLKVPKMCLKETSTLCLKLNMFSTEVSYYYFCPRVTKLEKNTNYFVTNVSVIGLQPESRKIATKHS